MVQIVPWKDYNLLTQEIIRDCIGYGIAKQNDTTYDVYITISMCIPLHKY